MKTVDINTRPWRAWKYADVFKRMTTQSVRRSEWIQYLRGRDFSQECIYR